MRSFLCVMFYAYCSMRAVLCVLSMRAVLCVPFYAYCAMHTVLCILFYAYCSMRTFLCVRIFRPWSYALCSCLKTDLWGHAGPFYQQETVTLLVLMFWLLHEDFRILFYLVQHWPHLSLNWHIDYTEDACLTFCLVGKSTAHDCALHFVQVRPEVLTLWLLQKQAEGFTCVGLEQTAESISMPSYSFPDR